ncbi:MAG: extracellular solute-binding protein [Lachnospiraceae bacterium]|nr:extracellular solute-binding protein [Lachnospiraceae bacterium]
MRKKVAGRLLSVLMAAAMTAGTLTGCGGSEGSAGDGAEGAQADASGASGETADGVEEFTIATVRWTDAWPNEFMNEGIMKELEEKHNIKINWQVYYNSDWTEQKSLLLASGDLPDAFFGSICLTETDVAQNKDYFVELTEGIEKNMPNLTAIFEKEPALKAAAQNRDGEIYSLVKKLPLRPKVANSMYINKEWLDNLGLSMPTTYEELTDVLKAFKEQDADGDGDPNNEIPYTNAGSLSGDLSNLLAPFGTIVSRTGNFMQIDASGNPAFVPITDHYKEAVKWAHELYAAGCLDQEYFTQDSSMASAKRMAEGGSQTGLVFAWTADAEMGENAGQFELCEAVAGPDGNRYVESDPTYLDIANRELIITTQCKNPDKLLQWADDFYTDLVSLQTYYGSIPDQVTDNGDGTYEVLLPADGTTLDTSAWSYSMRDFGPKYMTEEFQEKVILPDSQGDGVKLAQDETNAKYASDIAFPVVSYTTEQLTTLASLTTDINDYASAQYAHWVVDGGIEEEWDAYLAQLDQMGLQDVLAIHNDAYAAYKAIVQ